MRRRTRSNHWSIPSRLGLGLGVGLSLAFASPAAAGSLRGLVVPASASDWTAAEVLQPERDEDGVSRGSTSTGDLARGVEVALDGERLAVVGTHHDRGANYAAENLAALLARTADDLVDEGAPRLLIGDISARSGGDLRGHASHNCGRDVDVLFFTEDASTGAPAEPDRFVDFRSLEDTDDGLRFDIARNWAFVARLLADPDAEVQYVFVYDPLRVALLDYARAQGVDADTLERASLVLRQPSDSARHSDHFHVRVLCSARDRVRGCLNRGPDWPWANDEEAAVNAAAAMLVGALGEDGLDTSRWLDRASALEAPALGGVLAARLGRGDLEPARAAMALDAVAAAPVREWRALAAYAESLDASETTERPRLLAIGLIGRAGDPAAAPFLGRMTRHSHERSALRAVAALASLADPAVVPQLVATLGDDRPALRSAAVEALRSLTNHTGPAPDEGDLVAWWTAWLVEHGDVDRDAWLVAGFNAAGIPLASIEDTAAIPALIAAQTDADEHISLNAHRLLMRQVGYWFSARTPAKKRRDKWEAWWERNAWRFSEVADANPEIQPE